MIGDVTALNVLFLPNVSTSIPTIAIPQKHVMFRSEAENKIFILLSLNICLQYITIHNFNKMQVTIDSCMSVAVEI